MPTVRLRRLQADWESMQRLMKDSHFVKIEAIGNPPEKYVVMFEIKGLYRPNRDSDPVVREHHELDIYLHADYPRLQPRLHWRTDIFHPNILSPSHNGGVCIGIWTPAESLYALTVRVAEMVQYKIYNTHDPLDLDAAKWAEENKSKFPVDQRSVVIEH
jgi:ubiquitin-protein ligase